MKRAIRLLFFIIPICSNAQFNELLPGYLSFKRAELTIGAGYSLDSKGLNNEFINKYRSSGFLSNSLKDRALKNMKTINSIGGDFYFDLGFRSKIDSLNGSGWFVGVEQNSILDARFTKDLFHLYFYGNKPFAGKTVDLDNLQYKQISYQQVKAGFFKCKESETHRSVLALGLGYINGQDLVQIKTGNSSLYTAVDGTSIQLNLDLDSWHADSAKHSFGSMNGSGLALYLFYQWEKKNDYRVTFEMKDAGFVSWNKKTTHVAVDTNYYFDGVQVNNLLDSVYLEVKSIDEYKNGFFKENKDKKTASVLPVLLSLSFEKWLIENNVMAGIKLSYRYATIQIPVVELSGTWTNQRNIYAGIGLRYGGYGNFHGGIRFGFLPTRNWLIEIGSNYIDGFLLSSKRGGQGAFIHMGLRL